MKKILFTANSSLSMFFFRKGLIRSLISSGHEVHIIAPEDYKTQDLKSLGCIYHPVNFQTKNTNPFYDFLLILKLKKLYSSINPSVVFQYTIKPNIYGTIVAWLCKIPSVAIITGLGYAFLTDNWINKVVQQLYRFALKFSSNIWFLNPDDRELFIQKKLANPSKTFLLPGEGVNTTEFTPIKNISITSGITFLMIARILWDKGIYEYVEAAKIIKKEFPDTIFQLLGATDVDNPSAVPKKTVDTWHKQGIIQYLGISSDVRKEIAMADCIVLPSYREGISKTLMEAASMAKPLIATNVTGCRELIENNKTGLLCTVKSIDSLSEQLKKMILLPSNARIRMGEYGREKMISEFEETEVIKIYLDYINSSSFSHRTS